MRGRVLFLRSCMKLSMAGAQGMGQPCPRPMPWMEWTGAFGTSPEALPTQAINYLSPHVEFQISLCCSILSQGPQGRRCKAFNSNLPKDRGCHLFYSLSDPWHLVWCLRHRLSVNKCGVNEGSKQGRKETIDFPAWVSFVVTRSKTITQVSEHTQ